MKKLFSVVVIIVICFIFYQYKNQDKIFAEVEVSTYAEQLLESKNAYVGDASANGKILNLLNIGQELGEYSIELQTSELPYWIKLDFKDVVNDREEFDLKMFDRALIMLALIDNLEEVQWSYSHMEEGEIVLVTVYLSEEQATEFMGKNIKSFSKTESDMQELLDQVDI